MDDSRPWIAFIYMQSTPQAPRSLASVDKIEGTDCWDSAIHLLEARFCAQVQRFVDLDATDCCYLHAIRPPRPTIPRACRQNRGNGLLALGDGLHVNSSNPWPRGRRNAAPVHKIEPPEEGLLNPSNPFPRFCCYVRGIVALGVRIAYKYQQSRVLRQLWVPHCPPSQGFP